MITRFPSLGEPIEPVVQEVAVSERQPPAAPDQTSATPPPAVAVAVGVDVRLAVAVAVAVRVAVDVAVAVEVALTVGVAVGLMVGVAVPPIVNCLVILCPRAVATVLPFCFNSTVRSYSPGATAPMPKVMTEETSVG